MQQPQGFVDHSQPTMVCKLHKSLYDKQLSGNDTELTNQGDNGVLHYENEAQQDQISSNEVDKNGIRGY